MGRRADDGKRDEWIQRFRRRKTPGLTVATFREWQGVSVAAFYRWQKKLRAGESGGRSTAGIALPAKSSPSLPKAGNNTSPATNFSSEATSNDGGLFPSLQILRSLLPSNNLHPLNFLLRFLPCSFLWGGRRIRSRRSHG
ncbi:MAG: IS66 family insertion sequence element accessory protein TnpA [Planctomyces sp.]